MLMIQPKKNMQWIQRQECPQLAAIHQFLASDTCYPVFQSVLEGNNDI